MRGVLRNPALNLELRSSISGLKVVRSALAGGAGDFEFAGLVTPDPAWLRGFPGDFCDFVAPPLDVVRETSRSLLHSSEASESIPYGGFGVETGRSIGIKVARRRGSPRLAGGTVSSPRRAASTGRDPRAETYLRPPRLFAADRIIPATAAAANVPGLAFSRSIAA